MRDFLNYVFRDFFHFATPALYNMCTLLYMHFTTNVLCNTLTLQHLYFATYALCNNLGEEAVSGLSFLMIIGRGIGGKKKYFWQLLISVKNFLPNFAKLGDNRH